MRHWLTVDSWRSLCRAPLVPGSRSRCERALLQLEDISWIRCIRPLWIFAPNATGFQSRGQHGPGCVSATPFTTTSECFGPLLNCDRCRNPDDEDPATISPSPRGSGRWLASARVARGVIKSSASDRFIDSEGSDGEIEGATIRTRSC
jgi:hypothetical protein